MRTTKQGVLKDSVPVPLMTNKKVFVEFAFKAEIYLLLFKDGP